VLSLVVGASLLLGGCKAQSDLTITLQDKSSGTVNFSLELDEPAASAVRSDSFNSRNLVQAFDTKELEDAGFKVKVSDNKNGDPSIVELKAEFENENQLKNILAYLAPREVLDVKMISNSSLMRDAQELTVEIDVSKLRKSYLENDDVKKAIEESGIEFSEFEDLINEAMSSTTLNVKLISGSEMKSGQVKGDQTTKESLSVENNSLRTRYLLSMGFAILAIALGIALFWRVRRTPRLLSTNRKDVGEK